MQTIKEIKGYEGVYSIDVFGHVVNLKTGKRLKAAHREVGYLTYSLFKDKKVKVHYAHRLVASHFVDNPNNLPEVNHKNGDKGNNFYLNLEWVSRKDNFNHARHVLGTMDLFIYSSHSRKKHPNGGKKCTPVLAYKDNTIAFEFPSVKDAATAMNVHPQAIYGAIGRRNRALSCRGYRWEFKS